MTVAASGREQHAARGRDEREAAGGICQRRGDEGALRTLVLLAEHVVERPS